MVWCILQLLMFFLVHVHVGGPQKDNKDNGLVQYPDNLTFTGKQLHVHVIQVSWSMLCGV